MKTTFFDWIILPPGNTAILRFPFKGGLSDCELPEGLSDPRLATACELIVANRSQPYPWGDSPQATPESTSRLWKEKTIGVGGLIHTDWFVTSENRFGGASNVPKTGPGALRHYMYLDGGPDSSGILAENEGWAIVAQVSGVAYAYRQIQLHAAEHVVKDRGGIIVFPKDGNDMYHVGFVGRCMTCPNPELISLRALRFACPELKIELHPDWKGWVI